jgi:hypothetical protein
MEPVIALGAGVAFVCWADRCMSGAQLAGLVVVFIVMWGCRVTSTSLERHLDRLGDVKAESKSLPISARTSVMGPHPKKPTFESEHPDGAIADPYAFAYTDAALQTRRDSFVFRKTPIHPTSESRARMLAQMYQELLDASKKSDPGLRSTEHSGSDGCVPLKGRQPRPHLV